MSDHFRHDKTCENCGYTVDVAYCSNCGQKNTETRQSFHHLVTHFAEDLTHYDSGFWRTIKTLLFKPARLTQEYLSGKRQTYVPPVKLYIFISFITFFILSFVPKSENEKHSSKKHKTEATNIAAISDSVAKEQHRLNGKIIPTTIKELDSLQMHDNKKLSTLEYWIAKKVIILKDKNLTGEKLLESFFHTLPKVLFIYMPIFAFWLWLFHSKKRWYFFDHGIFTLHYFSLLLLASTINMIISLPLMYLPDSISDTLNGLVMAVTIIYTIFYFFRSHSRMYGERKAISRFKAVVLFFINLIFISIVLTISLFYSALNVH